MLGSHIQQQKEQPSYIPVMRESSILTDIAKSGKVGNWADSDDEESASMSPDEVSAINFKTLKDFFTLMDKDKLVSDVKNFLQGQTYQDELLRDLLTKTCELEKREIKVIASTVAQLRKDKLVTRQQIETAIHKQADKISKKDVSEDKVRAFDSLIQLLHQNAVLQGIQLTDIVRGLTSLSLDEIEKSAKSVDFVVDEVLHSDKTGEELVKFVKSQVEKKEPSQRSDLAVKLVSSLIAKYKMDAEVEWLEEDRFGAVLQYLFEDGPVEDQVKAINLLQKLFHKLNFPKKETDEEEESSFQACLMKLYSIVSEDAFVAWKENKYPDASISEEHRQKALSDAAEFLEFLDEDEE